MFRFLRAIGPAIIVASVVLGPGSILTSSKVGCRYAYDMLWVLVGAAILMIGMTALAARLGVGLKGTLCEETADRLGRPVAALVGVLVFLVVACFQSSNNIAVLASIEPLLENEAEDDEAVALTGEAEEQTAASRFVPAAALVALNGLIIAMLFGLRQLYKPIERMMMVLVMLMLAAFAANLFFARPSITSALGGLIPRLPADFVDGLVPRAEGKILIDPLFALQGLIATTFSVAGAYYQAYLVREKGWHEGELRQGLIDSVAGISVLGLVSAMIMITAASQLHGNVDPESLKSAGDVARQLRPAFGETAEVLFCLGIFAAAFSSFLVNAMIGGTLLADGLGLGYRMDELWPKLCTVAALVSGMVVAIAATAGGMDRVGLIVFAQALTVLGVPLLAFLMIFLATRQKLAVKVPLWMKAIATVGFVVTLALAARTAYRLWLTYGT